MIDIMILIMFYPNTTRRVEPVPHFEKLKIFKKVAQEEIFLCNIFSKTYFYII